MSLNVLIKHLHAALGAYLVEIGTNPVTSIPSEVQPELPLVTPETRRVESEKKATEATEPETKADEISPDEMAPPTVLDIQNPSFPRERLISFLVTRGYPKEEVAMLTRPELNKQALQAAEAMMAAGPGAKRRKKAQPTAPAPQISGDNAMATAVAALTDSQRAGLAKMMQIPLNENTNARIIELLGNVEGLNTALEVVSEQEGATSTVEKVVEPEVPVAVATVPSAPPVAIPAAPPVAAPAPVAVAEAPKETLGARILREASAELGYNGQLYNYFTHQSQTAFAPGLQQLLKANIADPNPQFDVIRQYLAVVAPPGKDSCNAECTRCPRGAGQLSACLKVFDDDASDYGPEDVVKSKSMVLFKPITTAIDDQAGGVAVVESVT